MNNTSHNSNINTLESNTLVTENEEIINHTSEEFQSPRSLETASNKIEDVTLIRNLFPELDLSDEDVKFLSNYLEQWLVDGELEIDTTTINMLNKHDDTINRLKSLFAKNKIMDVTERKITLSKIANGELTITRWKNTKDGPYPVEEEPSFNERITAINALTALDAIDNGEITNKQIIIDDIQLNISNE